MKTLKINKLILLLLRFNVVVSSCVQDDDFDAPNLTFDEPNITEVTEISALAGALAQAQDNFGEVDYDDEETTVSYTFNENDEYITGYVVSSDEAGNFFEELIIQDNFENPTIGIKLLIDVNPLFTRYEVGRKVYIKINGLSVGITNGVLSIGALNGTEVDKIASSQETQVILRSNEVATIVPLPMNIADFANDKTNMMIGLADTQFTKNEVINNMLTYAGEPSDEFDGERTLESCVSNASVTFSTSTFADFKGLLLPSGRGSVNGILTKDFFGDEFNVVINTPEDINYDNSVIRCDPFDINDFNIVFEEDFTSGIGAWEVANTVGTRSWVAADFGGDFYARASAFQGSGNPTADMVTWLISPSFDFDTIADAQMVLEIADAFSDAGEEPLKAFYSNDYTAGDDPATVTWFEIGLDQIEALPINTGFFDNEFDSTDLIDLSGVTGDGVVAFVYNSDGGAISSTRDLGNVKILTPQ